MSRLRIPGFNTRAISIRNVDLVCHRMVFPSTIFENKQTTNKERPYPQRGVTISVMQLVSLLELKWGAHVTYVHMNLTHDLWKARSS